MDKLQAWLKAKEAQNPSPSLQAEPASRKDKLKMGLKTAFRRVKQIPQREEYIEEKPWYSSLLEEKQEEAESYADIPAFDNTRVARYTTRAEDLPKARKELLATAREVRMHEDYDRLPHAEERIRNIWKEQGYEWTTPALIADIRKRVLQTALANSQADLSQLIREEAGISVYQIKNRLEDAVWLAKKLGIPFDRKAAFDQALREYEEHAPRMPVSQLYASFPTKVLAHSLPDATAYDTSTNPLFFNSTIPAEMKKKGKPIDFLRKLMKERPTLSCSAFNPNDERDCHFHPNYYNGRAFGVLIENGQIYNASDDIDLASRPVGNGMRLSGFTRGKGHTIEELVARAVQAPGTCNEFIVANPKVRAIFYRKGLSVSTAEREVEEMRALAHQHNLPFLEYDPGKGFRDATYDLAGATAA